MELDDNWGLSAEELDFLEQDALRKISERKASSAAASTVAAAFGTGAVSSSSQVLPPPSTLGFHADNPTPASSGYRSATQNQPKPSDKAQNPSASHGNVEAEKQPEGNLPKLSVKLFLHASGVIAAKFQYHPILVGAFHKVPKASWHAKDRLWMFPISSLSSAEEVLNGVSEAKVEVQRVDPFVHRALSTITAMPNLQELYERMPSFIETKLLPFQRDGVRFILQHGGRALLADEMGLGKTLQAIAVSACLKDSSPVLVLTPPALRLQWASMIQQWLNIPPCDILVVLSQHGGSNRAGFKVVYSTNISIIQLDGVYNIISYDIVAKLQDLLLASEFKIIIADESHFLKNAQAKRTSACLPILKKAPFKILLSGTPALSRPIELFKQLEALYPTVYNNVHEYGNRYCKGGIFGMYQGASNHEELHNLMKATVMIRRLKKDVLSELPTKRRQQVFLEVNEKDMKHIRPLFLELEVIKGNLKTCESAEQMESLKLIQKNLISKIYTCSAEAKISAVLDYLSTVVEAGCKFLVFAHHQPMIDSIHEFLLKRKVGCIRIDGSTPTSQRQSLVTEFQEKESITAAVLSIKAGGVGLTLTAASTVIFAELSWNPGDIVQAEDRAHRIGQASSVNVYYLLANDTVDDIIWDVLHNKLENLGQVLDGQESSGLDVYISRAGSSPTKQGTLDTFLKRCQGPSEEQRKLKAPRY